MYLSMTTRVTVPPLTGYGVEAWVGGKAERSETRRSVSGLPICIQLPEHAAVESCFLTSLLVRTYSMRTYETTYEVYQRGTSNVYRPTRPSNVVPGTVPGYQDQYSTWYCTTGTVR